MIHILHISSVAKICGGVKVAQIFSLSTRWQWVFSIILQPFYLPVKAQHITQDNGWDLQLLCI